MSKSTYATAFESANVTRQTEAIPGREAEMAKNNAGGVTFTISPFQQLERFLILGSDAPTYYQEEKKLTKENAAVIVSCLKLDGKKTIDMIVDVSVNGRAPKNDPALFALAVASSPRFGSADIAHYATSQLPKVARTGTHLEHYGLYIGARDANKQHTMRGVGRNLKNAYGRWFTDMPEGKLAYQLAKYQSRDGWSTKDLLALSHAKTSDVRKSALLAWATFGGLDGLKDASQNWNRTVAKKKNNRPSYVLTPEEVSQRRARYLQAFNILTGENANRLITAFEGAKKATTASEIVKLIHEGGLTHEMLPTEWKKSPEVWEALLDKMPPNAMVRNLGVMSKVGLLKPMSEASKIVVNRLRDLGYVQQGASKIHPLQALLAQSIYRQGHGEKGHSVWTPVPTIVDALEETYYLAFKNVVPTGQNHYIGLDYSGSMSSNFIGKTGLSAARAASAMALVIARTEPNYCIFGFSHQMKDIGITAKDSLESAMKKATGWTGGRTDCAQPMIHAGKEGYEVDVFLTITDNETWAGAIHPIQALKNYRRVRGKDNVKMVVMGMTATSFSIADPKDAYNLDVVGFDSYVPALVADFVRGGSVGTSESEDNDEVE